jgi:hydrophobic/amphiphilic exporter-1 (mainly G- bacteria), HAE1 family
VSDEEPIVGAPGWGDAGEEPVESAAASRWEGVLPRFSLNRRITVLVLLASTLVVGLVASFGIPLELFPHGFTNQDLRVIVPWQDAPAQEVVDKIILPLEDELATVRGLDQLNSYATTGFARLFLTFRQGADMDVAYREVRDRVQRARAQLPTDADRIYIRKDDASGIPVAFVGLGVDPAMADPYDLIQNTVVVALQRIDGVASVEVRGLEEKQVLIELDRQRTEAAGLNIYQVAQDLGGDNFTLASGTVRTGGKKLLLRSVARYADLEALENRLIAPNVRVRDVAAVRYAEPDKEYAIRVNSRPAVGLQVYKEGQANTLQVSRAIRATVDELKRDPRLGRIEMNVLFDQGSVILESLNTLVSNGKVGGLLAAAILFLFLRRLRMTLIITLSIPLSMLIALTVMYFAGETLNILSLLGLMICVGMLVDNSVVVAENIFRMHKAGLPRREACVRGAGEIALAITMATLTTVIVFLPVSLVEGQGQFFLIRMAIPVTVSLLASLLVALVFVPLAAYLTLPASGDGQAAEGGRVKRLHRRLNGVLHRLYDLTFERLNHAYSRLLAVFLNRRLDLVLALLVLTALTGAVMHLRHLKIVDENDNDRSGFELQVETPTNYTFEQTRDLFLAIEKVIAAKKDELGLDGYFFFHRTTFGHVEGWMKNPPTTDLTPREITERVLAALPERPGVRYYSGSEDESGEEKASVYTVTLNGDDPELLEKTAVDLEAVFTGVDGVVGVKKLGDRQPNELSLVIDRERAQRQGVNPAVVAGVVGYALRGQALPKFYAHGREVQVRVRFAEKDRESLDELADFAVPTGGGGAVPLSSLTEVRYSSAATQIRRLDKRVARTITLDLAEGKEAETRQRLAALTQRIDLPEGISFGDGPQRRGMNEETAAMLLAAGLSVVFIYLLMGFLFESFILPLSIILTIPMAGFGVVWAHVLTNRNIDALGMVGMVLLIGVVVNNGIVLIDYVNRLRVEGHPRREALLLAAHRRFRPIMMTALTTIFGLIPLTVSAPSSIGLSYKSFGYTLIGGLTTATFLTMLVVPIFYTFFDDARQTVGAALAGALRRRGWRSEAPPGAADAQATSP